MSGAGTDSVVVELRPSIPRAAWSDWLQGQLELDLVDGQHIHTEKGDDFVKLVFRGDVNRAVRLWKEKYRKLVYKGMMVQLKAVGIGTWDPTKFGASSYDRSSTDVQFEFDSHQDNEMLANLKDMGRVLDHNESRDILDIIDEIGEKLPAIQKCFEFNAQAGKNTKNGKGNEAYSTNYISVHGACKAMEVLLSIRVNVEDLLLEIESDDLMDVKIHSSTLRDPDSKHRPKLSYYQFLQLYLKLKRLKEEDPNIVSPRLSPRAKEEAEILAQRKVLLGVGDSFGRGAGSLEGLSPRTIAVITGQGSPSSVRSVSPRVKSPRPLQHVGEAPPAALLGVDETENRGNMSPLSPRLAGGGESVPASGSPRSATKRADANSISARLDSARRAEQLEENKERILKEYEASMTKQRSRRDVKENPKLDAIRRKRIARLESGPRVKKDMCSMLNLSDRTSDDGVVLLPASPGNIHPIDSSIAPSATAESKVPPLILPSQKAKGNIPSVMDRFIDQMAAKRHGALSDSTLTSTDINLHSAMVHAPSVGPSGRQKRVIEKPHFPALGVGRVEPRHWFITLNFWESLSRFSPLFQSSNSCSISKRELQQRRYLRHLLSATFANFDIECFYPAASDSSAKQCADSKDEHNQEHELKEKKAFCSDLADIMAALRIRASVRVTDRAADTIGAGGGTLELEAYMHTEVLKTVGSAIPASTNGDYNDQADEEASARLGTGEVYWAASPAWWANRLDEFRMENDTKAIEAIKDEKRKKRMAELRGLGVRNVHKMTKQQRLQWSLLQEQEAVQLAEEEKQRQRDRAFLGWTEFHTFFCQIVERSCHEAQELRKVLAAELWLNAKHRAIHDVTLRFIKDKAYHARKKEEAEFAAAREKERLQVERERRNADLYVGPEKVIISSIAEEKSEKPQKQKAEPENKRTSDNKEEKDARVFENPDKVEGKISEGNAEEEKKEELGPVDDPSPSPQSEGSHEEKEGVESDPIESKGSKNVKTKADHRNRKFFPGESDDHISENLDKARMEALGEGSGLPGEQGEPGDAMDRGPVKDEDKKKGMTSVETDPLAHGTAMKQKGHTSKEGGEEQSSSAPGHHINLGSLEGTGDEVRQEMMSSPNTSVSPSARERFKIAQMNKKHAKAAQGQPVSPMVSPRIDTEPEQKDDGEEKHADSPNKEKKIGQSNQPNQPNQDTTAPKLKEASSSSPRGSNESDGIRDSRHHVRAGERRRLEENSRHTQEEADVEHEKRDDQSPHLSAKERFKLRHAEQHVLETEDQQANQAATESPVSSPMESVRNLKSRTTPGSVESTGSKGIRDRLKATQTRKESREKEIGHGEDDEDRAEDLHTSLESVHSLSASFSPSINKERSKPGKGGVVTELELEESLDSGNSTGSPGKLSASERFKLRRLKQKEQEEGSGDKSKELEDTSTSDLEKSLDMEELDAVSRRPHASERRLKMKQQQTHKE